MLVTISFIILCLAFVAGPLLVLVGGIHIIRADDRLQSAVFTRKEEGNR